MIADTVLILEQQIHRPDTGVRADVWARIRHDESTRALEHSLWPGEWLREHPGLPGLP